MKLKRRQPSLPQWRQDLHEVNTRQDHERTVKNLTQDLPTGAQFAIVEVDNPLREGEKSTAIRSIRDDPLARMYLRSQIDSAKLCAGREYQRIYRIVESGARAIDPAKEYVDGGIMADPLSAERLKATLALKDAYRSMGILNSNTVFAVLCRGLMVKQFAEECGARTERQIGVYNQRFQDGLESLAILWGYAGRRT